MTLSPPVEASPEVQAYRQKIIDRLQGRDPIEVMAATPDAFAAMMRGVSEAELHARPAPGKWSACEILGHMQDADLFFNVRVRMVLCQERPVLLGYDQDLLVAGQRYQKRSSGELLEEFRRLRAIGLGLWRRIAPEQYDRVGLHSERGPESIGLMRQLMPGHDLVHIAQMQRHLDAVRAK